MPADLFDGRFASHRVAAWHNLGVVTDEVMTAVQALDRYKDQVVHVPCFRESPVAHVSRNHAATSGTNVAKTARLKRK